MSDKVMPQLVSVMTPFPYHIEANEPAYKAAEMMKEMGHHQLPVMDGGVIESIIAERDIARATTLGHSLKEDDTLLVSDICPSRIYVADVSDPLDKILEVMADKHLNAVIVAKDGELAGIFTEFDAFRLLSEMLHDHYRSVYDDGGNDAA